MATRRQVRGFDGTMTRWVTRADVAALAAEAADLVTVGDLLAWCGHGTDDRGTPTDAGRSRLVRLVHIDADLQIRPVPADSLDDDRRARHLRRAVAALAITRRRDSITDHASAHRLSVPAAVARLDLCPTCHTRGPFVHWPGFYCFDHAVDELDEADRLISTAAGPP